MKKHTGFDEKTQKVPVGGEKWWFNVK
jgi:hypothetical protein